MPLRMAQGQWGAGMPYLVPMSSRGFESWTIHSKPIATSRDTGVAKEWEGGVAFSLKRRVLVRVRMDKRDWWRRICQDLLSHNERPSFILTTVDKDKWTDMSDSAARSAPKHQQDNPLNEAI